MFTMILKGNCRILLTCGTNEQVKKLLQQKLWDKLKKIPLTKSNWQTLEFHFETGAELHLKTVESYHTAEGLEYDAWFADEIQDHSEEAVKVFHSRTRRARDKCLFRIVGMPAEPEHFMYAYFAENGFTLHEITLYDHPSQEWIDFYEKELKALYHGKELDRYLFGKRVSLSGIGIFATNDINLTDCKYDPAIDVELCWDFNSEFRAVTMWQNIGKHNTKFHPVLVCVKSFEMKGDTLHEDAVQLCEELKGHKGLVILNGDASGDNKQTGVTGSMWKAVREQFAKVFAGQMKYVVPTVNPSVKDTIQCVNWALKEGLVMFDNTHAKKAYNSLTACKADKFGEIDKSVDYKPGAVRTHHADTVRYAVWRTYSKLYPSGRNRYALYA
jgi:hypothetical protein